MPIYSGGLGVLAGDHIKSASGLGIPMIAVGLVLSLLLTMSWRNLIGSANEVDFSLFWTQLQKSNVAEVTQSGGHIVGKWKIVPESAESGGKKLTESFSTNIPDTMREAPELREQLSRVTKYKAEDATPQLLSQFLFGHQTSLRTFAVTHQIESGIQSANSLLSTSEASFGLLKVKD